MGGCAYARGYEARMNSSAAFGISVEESDILVESLGYNLEDKLSHVFFSVSPRSVSALNETLRSLLLDNHFMKKLMVDQDRRVIDSNKFYKVKIAPIILFTDDTSGNRSKQYNAYESWSMKCAALSFKERSSIANIHFTSAIPKKDGAGGISLLPCIVDDLKQLEEGMIMYSAEHDEDVLVVAPLLWLEADTPCHSELCGLYSPTSLYPCRKCYTRLRRGKQNLEPVGHT
jgi:hypothetical protein